MKTMTKSAPLLRRPFATLTGLGLTALALAWPAAAEANRALPKPVTVEPKKPQPVVAQLSMSFEHKARSAVIRLPHVVFERLLAAEKARKRKRRSWLLLPEGRTMIAGVALALGFAFTGIWLARGRRRRLALGPLLIALGIGALLVFGGTAEGKKKKIPDAEFGSNKLVVSVIGGRTVKLEIAGEKICPTLYE